MTQSPDPSKETFEDFIQSFFYGSRSDMSFKFLEHLSEEDSSDFLCALFRDIIDALDDNDLKIIKKRLVQGQIKGYEKQANFDYDNGPFHRPQNSLPQMKIALFTSSGHFMKSDPPTYLGIPDMTQAQAEEHIFDFLKEEPVLSKIPLDASPDQLTAIHGGYDTRASRKDPNVAFPWQILKEFQKTGVIKDLTKYAYSFVGACSQKRLIKKTLPRWEEELSKESPDAVLLVPV